MSNPFGCGPNPCRWPCGPVTPPPVPCVIVADEFYDLSGWDIQAGTPSAVGNYLSLPVGPNRLQTVDQHPIDPAVSYVATARSVLNFDPAGPGRFSVGVCPAGEADFSNGVEVRVSAGIISIFRYGVLVASGDLEIGDFGEQLLYLAVCASESRVDAYCVCGGRYNQIIYDGTIPVDTAAAVIDCNQSASTTSVDRFEYEIAYHSIDSPQCEQCTPCQFCERPYPETLTVRIPQWLDDLFSPCTNTCAALNGDRELKYVSPCFWRGDLFSHECRTDFINTYYLTAELRLTTHLFWRVMLYQVFDLGAATYRWESSSLSYPFDCSIEVPLIWQETSLGWGLCYPAQDGVILNPGGGSAGAMHAPPMEFRRGKPVVPKGKPRKG